MVRFWHRVNIWFCIFVLYFVFNFLKSNCLLSKHCCSSKDVPQSLSCLFLVAFEKKAFWLQTFVEQLDILVTHHIPAHKSYVMQTKSAHNHTFLHKVGVVNPLIIMQVCDIHFKNLKVTKMNEICFCMKCYVSSINL